MVKDRLNTLENLPCIGMQCQHATEQSWILLQLEPGPACLSFLYQDSGKRFYMPLGIQPNDIPTPWILSNPKDFTEACWVDIQTKLTFSDSLFLMINTFSSEILVHAKKRNCWPQTSTKHNEEQWPANQFLDKCNLSPHCSLLYTDYNHGQLLHGAIREEIGDELSWYSRIDLIEDIIPPLIWFTHIL